MIRVTQSQDSHETRLFVEGTLSDGWVESLEECWIRARADSRIGPVRIDLSSVTYVDDKGRELLMRMKREGVAFQTGILTREVIAEIIDETEFSNREKLAARDTT